MQRYIIYKTATGKIESVLKLTDLSKNKMLANNPDISMQVGSVQDVNKYQMNVSVTPHVVEVKPEPTVDIAKHVRITRNQYLKACDWTQTTDSPLSDSKKAEWATYRQALRDMPASADNWATIDDITWPSQPS